MILRIAYFQLPSVTVRLASAPRGAGIVTARVPKKVLQFAGIDDVFTMSRGSTKTLGNFAKVVTLISFVSLLIILKCNV
nr:40S ribosomal protein S2-4-like [Tanacetum cinerariifolium]